MALKASILKVNLSVANIDNHHYQDYNLTVAKHPSETDTRLVIRLAAFALYAKEEPQFTKGLCDDDEPDLWVVDPTGQIQHWIELGQPSEKRIRQACSKSQQVTFIGYNETKFKAWVKGLDKRTLGTEKINMVFLKNIGDLDTEELAQKNMELSATLQEGQILLGCGDKQVTLEIKGRDL